MFKFKFIKRNTTSTSRTTSHKNQKKKDAIADSGTTIHCVSPTDETENKRYNPVGIRAAFANGGIIKSQYKCDLKVATLSENKKKVTYSRTSQKTHWYPYQSWRTTHG